MRQANLLLNEAEVQILLKALHKFDTASLSCRVSASFLMPKLQTMLSRLRSVRCTLEHIGKEGVSEVLSVYRENNSSIEAIKYLYIEVLYKEGGLGHAKRVWDAIKEDHLL